MAGSQASGARMLGSFNIVTLLYSPAKKNLRLLSSTKVVIEFIYGYLIL